MDKSESDKSKSYRDNGHNNDFSVGEARRKKARAELGTCEPERDDEEQGTCLGMRYDEFLLNKRHQRRENKPAGEIQKK